MAVTGTYVTSDAQITNYLSAELRTNLTDDDEPRQQELLDECESVIDSHLARRFQLPIASPGSTPALRGCALALLHEKLEYLSRRVNDDTVAAADRCREWLAAIASGEIALANEDDQSHKDVSSIGMSLKNFEARRFTDGTEVDGDDTTKPAIGINVGFTGKSGSRV